MKRVKQYLKAIKSRVFEEDYKFLLKILNEKELEYFNRLPEFEKRHALDTCYYIIEKYGVEDEDLIKAALFHDIGKIKAPLTVHKKVLAVVLERFPFIAMHLKKYVWFLKVYYDHPKYSRDICREMGCNERVVYFVEHHHDKEVSDEGLKRLQEADKMS
ncbi:HDIG domain-containing metalloprotein [Caldanaerobacter sp.]|uniref:HDIG domain-containing metalloprotein n=1 Tax=Caldanaerobacter sp. TaxID=2930036 RepID=UPI003C72067A